MLCTYARWFQRPQMVSVCPAQLRLPRRTVQRYLRFRSGCHGLPVDLGRRTGTPRVARVCALCHAAFGDEYHLVFECAALHHLRVQYGYLFTDNHQGMLALMWQDDQVSVAKFVDTCLHLHDDATVA